MKTADILRNETGRPLLVAVAGDDIADGEVVGYSLDRGAEWTGVDAYSIHDKGVTFVEYDADNARRVLSAIEVDAILAADLQESRDAPAREGDIAMGRVRGLIMQVELRPSLAMPPLTTHEQLEQVRAAVAEKIKELFLTRPADGSVAVRIEYVIGEIAREE